MPLKTMICFVLDRSGSMRGQEKDVIGGVNATIEDQKKLPDPASVAMVRFDTGGTERFVPMQPLEQIKPLTLDDFKPRGGTPLLDAVGYTITQLDEDWKRENPDRAIVVIVTDGHENSSSEYTKEKVQGLIKAREASGQWAFIYLGANVDAFAEAGHLGIRAANTAGYTASSAGVSHAYSTVSGTLHTMRSTGKTAAVNLGGNIQEDGTLQPPVPNVGKMDPPAVPSTATVWHPPQ